ncbi:hypothetical protein [Sporosarcina sp. FSL K6-5500]|uniref:hypothetical protein n=1 Tax=Sporosarcina sp. FSL K6-5500 TaxID=2921558 RepID=UPI0030F9212C
MKLKYISEETLADLRTNYTAYQSHYYNADDAWFDDYFKEQGKVLTSNISFEVPKMNLDIDYSMSDRENVKISDGCLCTTQFKHNSESFYP